MVTKLEPLHKEYQNTRPIQSTMWWGDKVSIQDPVIKSKKAYLINPLW